jgi:hypothetical protein
LLGCVRKRQGDASASHGSDEIIEDGMRETGGMELRVARGMEQRLAPEQVVEETQGEMGLGRYEVYVVSPQLKGELGIALIDTGSQVSLVKEVSLIKPQYEEKEIKIQGVTGSQLKVKGKIDIMVKNTLEPLAQECFVVDRLPRNLDLILGQDWLENNGIGLQKKTPILIPTYSEQFVKCGTRERGFRYIEHQTLQLGLVCATSLVNCENVVFPCLVENLTDKPIAMSVSPRLEKPPTMIANMQQTDSSKFACKRLKLLNENLRLSHMVTH